ncbi:MAG: tetratricopeptide repeat protein, partial [Gemmataceae bacterium]|nr:tetratricopeptide repeat protein [Gemmataceae bacterium]
LECGLTDQVLADGERLTQLEPSNPYARSLRGYACLAQQRFHEALEYFHQAIQLDPELLTARIGRIQAYLQLRQGMEAEADCTAILSLKSEDSVVAIAYELRGLARRLQGRWQDACADFTAALQHNPTVELYNRRAEMYYYAGEYAAALRDHMQALKLDPHNPQTLNMLAWIWSTCPDPEFRNGPRAKECATRACELTEWSEPGLIDTLAAACAECGDYDLAVQWQTRAVELVEQKGNANDTTRQDYQARCELYRQRKPFRTPWGPLSQLLP